MDYRICEILENVIRNNLPTEMAQCLQGIQHSSYGLDVIVKRDTIESMITDIYAELKYIFDEGYYDVIVNRKTDTIISIDGSALSIVWYINDDYEMGSDDEYATYEEAKEQFVLIRNRMASDLYRYHHWESPSAPPHMPDDILLEIEYCIDGHSDDTYLEEQVRIDVNTLVPLVAQFIKENKKLLTAKGLKELARKAEVTFPNAGEAVVENICTRAGIDFMRYVYKEG